MSPLSTEARRPQIGELKRPNGDVNGVAILIFFFKKSFNLIILGFFFSIFKLSSDFRVFLFFSSSSRCCFFSSSVAALFFVYFPRVVAPFVSFSFTLHCSLPSLLFFFLCFLHSLFCLVLSRITVKCFLLSLCCDCCPLLF